MRRHLTSLGFQKTREGVLVPLGNDKDVIRTVHGVQRDDRLAANRQFISDKLPKLLKHFASGADVATTRISPVLERRYSDLARRPLPSCFTDLVSSSFKWN
jgi:hypothetical protein